MRESGHLLPCATCAISDWLVMALISGFAFAAALILLVAIGALTRYLFAE